MHYKLSSEAKSDLRRIYRHGFVEFGEVQADLYFSKLLARFKLLGEQPHLFLVAHEIESSLRKSVCGADVIYYDIIANGVLIVRILGRQDRGSLR